MEPLYQPPVRVPARAEDAKDGCPISGALEGNVELSVEAALAV
jgi:organic hydroperoxide reductase OsmC/OhrA